VVVDISPTAVIPSYINIAVTQTGANTGAFVFASAPAGWTPGTPFTLDLQAGERPTVQAAQSAVLRILESDDIGATTTTVLGTTVPMQKLKLTAVGASGVSVNVTKIRVKVTVGAGAVKDHVTKVVLLEGTGTTGDTLGDEIPTTTEAAAPGWDGGGTGTSDTMTLVITNGFVVNVGTPRYIYIALKLPTEDSSPATLNTKIEKPTFSAAPGAVTWATYNIYAISAGGSVHRTIQGEDAASYLLINDLASVTTLAPTDKGTLTYALENGPDAGGVTPVRGQPDVAIGKITVTAAGEPIALKSLVIRLKDGTATPDDIYAIRLFGAKADGTIDRTLIYDSTMGTWVGDGSNGNEYMVTVTLTTPLQISIGKTNTGQKVIYVAIWVSTIASAHPLQLEAAAVGGELKGTGLVSGKDIDSTAPTAAATTATANIAEKGTLSFSQSVGDLVSAGELIRVGQTLVSTSSTTKSVIQRWVLSAGLENVTLREIKLLLWKDSDGDGVIDSGEIPSGVPADIANIKFYTTPTSTWDATKAVAVPVTLGSWTGSGTTADPFAIKVTFSPSLLVPKGSNIYLWMAIETSRTAIVGHEIMLNPSGASDIKGKGVWSGADITASAAPDRENNAVKVVGDLQVTGVSEAPTAATAGQTKVKMLKLTLTAIGEEAKNIQLTPELHGVGAFAGDIAKVQVYEDAAGELGTLLAESTTLTQLTLPTGFTIPAGTSKIIHITIDIKSTAAAGHVLGLKIKPSTMVYKTTTGGTTALNPLATEYITSGVLTIVEDVSQTLDYVAGTLTPRYAKTDGTVQFTLRIKMTGSGTLTLTTATTLRLSDGVTTVDAPLTSSVTITGPTSEPHILLTFTPKSYGLVKGTWTPTLTLRGTDPYGKTFTVTPATALESILFENNAPTITNLSPGNVTVTRNTAVTITVKVTDTGDPAASGLDRVYLKYRVGPAAEQSVLMFLAAADTYTYTIPASEVTADITYYITATDRSGNTATSPINTITVPLPDTTPPTITHTPVTTAAVNTPVTIRATVTDNVAVQSVTLYYRTVGAPAFTSLAMAADGNVYTATIPATAVTTAGVEYYIVATDTSNNQARAPTTGTYTIQVTTFTAPASTPTRVHPVTGTPLPAQVSAGSSVGASTTVTNLAAQERTVRIFFVVEKEGVPLLYGSATVKLAAAQSFDAMQGWILVEPGTYTIRITVTDATTGVSLSEEQTVTYTVVG
jgi:hypothetical protein